MGMFFHSADAPPERPADPEVRRANLNRIGRLFAAYRLRLGGVLVLIVVAAGLGVVPAFLLKNVLEAIGRNDTTSLSYNAGGIIAIAIATGVLGVIQTLLSNQIGQRVMHDLRAAVFRHLQRLSLGFFTRTRTGEVQSRISNDIGGVQNVVTNTATSIASNVTTVAATMVGMLVLNWKLALFAFALIPLFVVLTRRVGNERRRIAKTTQETLADISSLVQESLSVSGILLGKTMGRGDELADRFEADSLRLADLEVRQRMAGRWVMASIQTSFAVMPAAVYWFGGLALAQGSTAVSIPMLVAFTTLQTRLFFPVGSLLGVGLDLQTSLALFDRIFEYLDQPIDIDEKPDALAVGKAGDVVFDQVWFRYGEDWTVQDVSFTTLQTRLFFPVGSLLGVGLDVQTSLALFDRIFEYLDQPIDIEEKPDALAVGQAGDVVFDQVWFRYGEDWTLQDVSFTVPAGSTTALVGETGSGKTTLGYLAARLYDPSRGRVTIGGVDIRDLSFEGLSDLVGVVSQETYLFHESVRENLRFAKPDATDEEIEAAAEAARIHHVIAALPEGYETVVGERGYRFSGGEKQRIAIARTILRNPPILVLDEATSSLDTETERLVQDALDRLAEGRTTIAIAHRLSTVRDADQIIVLDRGRVVESGRHEDLILAGGRYSALAARDAELGSVTAAPSELPAPVPTR
jgi:ATP-binding cassette subfamily B protein